MSDMGRSDAVFGPRIVGKEYPTDRFWPSMARYTVDNVRSGVDGEALAKWAIGFGHGYDVWMAAWRANRSNFLDVLAWGHDHDFGHGLVAKGTMDDRHVTNLERVVRPGGLDPEQHIKGKRCLVIGAYCGGEVLLLHALGAAQVDALEEVPEYAAACARLCDAFDIKQTTYAASLFELPDAWERGGAVKVWSDDGGPAGLSDRLPDRARYDLVYCPGVIYHCTDQVAALRIMRELAVPGGAIFFETGVADGFAANYQGPRVPGWNWWVCGPALYIQMMTDVGMASARHIDTLGGRAWFGGVRGEHDPLAEHACAGFSIPALLGRRTGYRGK